MSSELVARLRDGEAEAFREALRLHGDAVFTFLRRLTGERALAEDLFQETWLKLARSAARLEAGTRLERWLLTVARNAYRSHRRWALVDVSRWLVAEHDVDGAGASPSPEQAAAAGEEVERVERALLRLRPGDRELLLLAALGALDPADFGIEPEALRQRLSRARKALSLELKGGPLR